MKISSIKTIIMTATVSFIVLMAAHPAGAQEKPLFRPYHKRVERQCKKFKAAGKDNYFSFKPLFDDCAKVWYYTDSTLVVITYDSNTKGKGDTKEYPNDGLGRFPIGDEAFSTTRVNPENGNELSLYAKNLGIDFHCDAEWFLENESLSVLEEKIKKDFQEYVYPAYEPKEQKPFLDEFSGKMVYATLYDMPEYNGGEWRENLRKEFQSRFHYNFKENERFQKVLHFQMVVDKNGVLSGARIYTRKNGKPTPFEEEGLKTLMECQNWTPGKKAGENVNVILTFQTFSSENSRVGIE